MRRSTNSRPSAESPKKESASRVHGRSVVLETASHREKVSVPVENPMTRVNKRMFFWKSFVCCFRFLDSFNDVDSRPCRLTTTEKAR